MTNATIHGTEYGIYAYTSRQEESVKSILRIGNDAKVSSDECSPLFLSESDVYLDISGNCEFRPRSNIRAITGGTCVDSQAGISGGRFYGSMPDDKDKYLAAGYKWTNMVSKLESYWTPMPVDAPPPPANDGIRIEGGKVFSGDYEITGAVTVRGDGSVELNPGGSVGGVSVTPVIGNLPSAEAEGRGVLPDQGAVEVKGLKALFLRATLMVLPAGEETEGAVPVGIRYLRQYQSNIPPVMGVKYGYL